MLAAAVAPTPTPAPGSPVLDLFTEGLTWQELWALLWPGLLGAGLGFAGIVLVMGYVTQWISGIFPPH